MHEFTPEVEELAKEILGHHFQLWHLKEWAGKVMIMKSGAINY
jgi:hypothetical protein